MRRGLCASCGFPPCYREAAGSGDAEPTKREIRRTNWEPCAALRRGSKSRDVFICPTSRSIVRPRPVSAVRLG